MQPTDPDVLATDARTCVAAPRTPQASTERGLSLVEVLITTIIVVLVAMMGVMHVVRTRQHLDWTRHKSFAREKAVSILDELRSLVEGSDGEAASDLDAYDDGIGSSPVLTISRDPLQPDSLVAPDHPTSSNVMGQGQWLFSRRISVRPYGTVESRDLRFVTVRVFRRQQGEQGVGEEMAKVASVIRTIGESYPSSQVYDIYLLALENVPGWWVRMDAIQPFIQATLTDLESRNGGLRFRTHWITKQGFGRDEEYAPYGNEVRTSREDTPWTYVYPGRMPDGESALRYYLPTRMQARMNLDGVSTPQFVNELSNSEPYSDTNGNGQYDRGEPYTDWNYNERRDTGNPAPYALADMHNHCMRWPDAQARFAARVEGGVDDDAEPTWRLLLDRMVSEPDEFHNAILINLHGELIPAPPARNYSDAAKDPAQHPGWRVVTHPEQIRPRRVAGSSTDSDTPRFRVYAYKTAFDSSQPLTLQPLMTQREPLQDLDDDGVWDDGEEFRDWNGDGVWNAGTPISVVVRDGDFGWNPNGSSSPSIRVRCLAGGVDADGNGTVDPYTDWALASSYPEVDETGDGKVTIAESWFDLDGNGEFTAGEPWLELDGNGVFSTATESYVDANGNGRFDPALPAEPYDDVNGNGRWDGGEIWWDRDGDGVWTEPTAPQAWVPWMPALYGSDGATDAYIAAFGEPFLDSDGDKRFDPPEPFFDANRDGAYTGGVERGEMWYEIESSASPAQTVLRLHATPLETPLDATTDRGLPSTYRLYDLDYVPCPTPSSATGTDRFSRDLYTGNDDVPKNTARWRIELPLEAVRRAFERTAGARDGDRYDRVIGLETRLGSGLTTGTMWPTRDDPQNLSVAYAWFCDSVDDVPFSERYQFQGDPRHSPYADTDALGTTAPHGYNWYFDNFTGSSGDARGKWLAFDTGRLRDGWAGRGGGLDIPRLLSWIRQAIVESESIYTSVTGFNTYYLSVGGDVGFDAANGFSNGIPMDGRPFGLTSDVYENTIIDGAGSSSVRGSIKHVVSNAGTTSGIRAGGGWWSKPWLGELFDDDAYASQWMPYGNLQAAAGTADDRYHLVRRGALPCAQQPMGTELVNRYSRLGDLGCTSLFNIGTTQSSFHHAYADGQTGSLVEDGLELALAYNFAMPDTATISRPFSLTLGGGVGDDFWYPDAYPRYTATLLRRYYDHRTGHVGSGLVQLTAPDGGRSGYVLVNGLDRTLGSGSAFIARFTVLSLVHSFFSAGAPDLAKRIHQVPRVEIQHPTMVHEMEDPSSIDVRWTSSWTRWDGRNYTQRHDDDFTEDESDVRYVLIYSRDGGATWLNVLDDSPAQPGVLPMLEGLGPDPSLTLLDRVSNGDESYTWPTPVDRFPQGSYMLRIETYRASEALHFSYHQEKFHVQR